MKLFYSILRSIIFFISGLVFCCGVTISALGIYDFVHAFSHLQDAEQKGLVGLIAIGLLQAVDLFLLAIVLFIFSIGLLLLFRKSSDEDLPNLVPQWLRISNFMQLKVILWEAILTTLVVIFLVGLVRNSLQGEDLSLSQLILPGAIMLISMSLFFLKRGEH